MENKLTAEQIEKIKECKNMEELKKLVQTENIELTDEQFDDVAGGNWGKVFDPLKGGR